jgi:hypothetical protein
LEFEEEKKEGGLFELEMDEADEFMAVKPWVGDL